MLTGRRLFEGETVSHTLAHVLTAPIDFDQLPTKTPLAICDLLRRCLDRDVKTRENPCLIPPLKLCTRLLCS